MRAFLRSKSFWIPTVLCALFLVLNISNSNDQLILTVLSCIILSFIFAGFLFGGILYVLVHKIKSSS